MCSVLGGVPCLCHVVRWRLRYVDGSFFIFHFKFSIFLCFCVLSSVENRINKAETESEAEYGLQNAQTSFT